MNAYQGIITKKEFVSELKKHQKADAFIRRTYWNGSKGCAVGCSIESISRVKKLELKTFDDHSKYPELLGIPEWLARVEDQLFEGMTEGRSKKWPVQFAQAINPGANLESVKVPFIVMLLEHTLVSMDAAKFDAKKWPEVANAIEGSKSSVLQMIEAQKSGDRVKISAARSAADSAYLAAYSAYLAARSAADSAAESARSAAESARSAAESAYLAAESAADSARSAYLAAYSAYLAAESAYLAAYSAYLAAESAADSARSAAFDYYADRLLEFLKEAK